MNELMSVLKISDFKKILSAYKMSGINIGNCLDGGAGSGHTARSMLSYIDNNSTVFAFEPFPGNHKFFTSRDLDARVKLIPKALAECHKKMSFYVPSTVTKDSNWGRRGMEGYSSVGYLTNKNEKSEKIISVDCVSADDEISPDVYIGFVKLDLQGGESDALKGMRRILNNALFLWIEFIGNNMELYNQILEYGYIIYDTEYLFLDEPTESALEIFDVSNPNKTLSTGRRSWRGYKKMAWKNFEEEFIFAKNNFSLVQTDLLCINKRKVKEFLSAIKFISPQLEGHV